MGYTVSVLTHVLARLRALAWEVALMNRRGAIRLSTMEIILIGTLLGSLLLGLLQAFQYERFLSRAHQSGDDKH